jgi:uncharacterized cupredoxin-like copper-binding protein
VNIKSCLRRFALTTAVAAGSALAHGPDHAASSPKAFDATKVEETPFGRQGDPGKVSRTIRIAMSDNMRFTPAHIVVRRGETVRVVAANKGQVLHELVLGTEEALKEHAALMKKFPEMEHDEPHMTHVKPGQRGDVIWQFTRAGEFHFACLVPGHFEAGMVGKVTVK